MNCSEVHLPPTVSVIRSNHAEFTGPKDRDISYLFRCISVPQDYHFMVNALDFLEADVDPFLDLQ